MSKNYVHYNANPINKRVGDCTVRAISVALDEPWDDIYMDLAIEGFELKDMPTANHVWGAYLKRRGWTRHIIPEEYIENYTVEMFCVDHPIGTYILGLDGHVIPVIDGHYYDSWDSGNEIPHYYWSKIKYR